VKRLLVVRLGSLGDLVHTLPAVTAIHRTFPAVEIDWLVDAPHRDFLALVPLLADVIVLRDRSAGAWLAARSELRARDYDVALDFQGLLKSAALARLSGAQRVIGFTRKAAREGLAAPFYSERVEAGQGQHVIAKNLALARSIGATTGTLEFPLIETDVRVVTNVRDALMRAGLGADYALINPGAAWPNKRWPPVAFGHVTTLLRDQHGLSSVVLWGPGERDAADAIVQASGGAAVLAPETSLPDLVALARHARLIVSGDTGPLHIAAAVGVPAVGLFGPTNPRRNGPWKEQDVSISRYEVCDCHYERRCRRDDERWCLGSISVDEVAHAIDRRLRQAVNSATP
jgi:lipopolysaccharide heptosyltransferase I